jgi:NADH-quinone oxidoreductase subunit I
MFGQGLIKGLGVTLKEFVTTYLDDLKRIPSRYAGGREVIDQSDVDAQAGLFTIQYPEERRKLPERFRYMPMLLVDAETGEDRCTACGICAKACPPQCIWIVRARDDNGKPVSRPAQFWIDTSVCMNCGLCAEFCPFDSIKMNHVFEIAAYQRMPYLVYDLNDLRVLTTYYAQLRPSDWAAELAARAEKEAEKAAKEAEKAARAAAKPPAAAPANASPEVAGAAPTTSSTPAKRSPEEIERLRAEAAARRAAREGSVDAAAAPSVESAAPATSGTPAKRSPEEIERLKAEAAARRAAKAAQDQRDS